MDWNIILSVISDVATPIVAVIVQALVAVLIVVSVRLGGKFLKKVGVNIEDDLLKEIEEVVKKTVKTINQTFVDDIKDASENHKLTEDQREQAYNMAYETILQLLSNEQLTALHDKYGDIATPIKVMIESTISDFKAPDSTGSSQTSEESTVLNG